MRKAKPEPPTEFPVPSGDRAATVIQSDHWTQPLTSSDCGSGPDGRGSPTPITWMIRPDEPGCTPVTGLWVRRAIASDPLVQEWQRDHAAEVLGLSQTGRAPETAEQLVDLIHKEFAAEGGAEAVTVMTSAVEAAHAHEVAGRDPGASITHELPNGMRLVARASDVVLRSPVVTLTFPSGEATASLSVLRDARLGRLSTITDELARRYLVPASEIVFCILTGQSPRVSPVRLGVRFRRFDVDGVPVTATSRLVLDVDPQLEPAELARIFVQWQRTSGVKASKPSPKLVTLAAELVGRLSLVPADHQADGRSHPSEILGIGNRSLRLVPAVPWVRLAREIKYDPQLIRGRAAAVVHLLLPLDAPRALRWLPQPQQPEYVGAGDDRPSHPSSVGTS